MLTFLGDAKSEKVGRSTTQIHSRRTKLLLSTNFEKPRVSASIKEANLCNKQVSCVTPKSFYLLLLGGGAVRAPIMVDPEVPLIFPTYPPSLSRTTWERIKCTALKKKSISFITLEGEKSEFRASGNYTVHILHNYDVVGGLLGELVKFVCYFLFF